MQSLNAFSPSAFRTYPHADSTFGTLPPFTVSIYAFARFSNYGPVKKAPCKVFGFILLNILLLT